MLTDNTDDPKLKILRDAGELISELEHANNSQSKISLRNVAFTCLTVALVIVGLVLQIYIRGDEIAPVNPIAFGLTIFLLFFQSYYLYRKKKLNQIDTLFLGILTVFVYLVAIFLNKSLPVNMLPVVIAFISLLTTSGVALILGIVVILCSGLVLYDPVHGVNFAIASRILISNFILLGVFQLYSRNYKRLTTATLNVTTGLKKITESLSDDLLVTTLERDSARERDLETGLLNHISFRKKIRNLLPIKAVNRPLVFFRIEIIQVAESLRGLSEKTYLELLQKVANKISEFAGEEAVTRSSKWEFLCCMEIGESEEKFRKDLLILINELKQILRSTASSFPNKLRTGVAIWPDDGRFLEDVLGATEIALVLAHQNGNSQPVWYQASMRSQINELRQLSERIETGIAAAEFYFDYQPVVSKDLKSIEFYECLIRWKHPVLGILSPGRFIPLAIEHGQIMPLTIWALQHASQNLKSINRDRQKPVRFSVNIAPSFIVWMLKNKEKAFDFFDGLQCSAGTIILEITEESFIDSSENVVKLLEALHAKGFLIALDDFGAGYSSLSKVATLPLDYLKMDMSLVTGIEKSERKQKTYEAMTKLGQQLGIKVVSEGIETQAELDTVSRMAVDFIQGYVISRPHAQAEIGNLSILHKP